VKWESCGLQGLLMYRKLRTRSRHLKRGPAECEGRMLTGKPLPFPSLYALYRYATPTQLGLRYATVATGTTQSVQRLATGWTVRGSSPGWGKEFSLLHTRSDRLWDPPSLWHNEYLGSFPGVQGPGCGADHQRPPPPQRATNA
jgi:hypothetical protein